MGKERQVMVNYKNKGKKCVFGELLSFQKKEYPDGTCIVDANIEITFGNAPPKIDEIDGMLVLYDYKKQRMDEPHRN